MVRTFLNIARIVVVSATSVPVLELVGAVLIVVAVCGLAGVWWAVLTAGLLLLVKAFEKALPETGV